MESEKNKELVCPKCANINKQGDKVCFNCGYSFTEGPQKLLDISQTLKSTQIFGICCVSWLAMLLIIFTIFSFIEWGAGGVLVLLIGALAIFFMAVFVKSLAPSAGKIRSFIVTDEKIEICVPNKPIFQIGWSEFDSIEIERKITGYRQYKRTFYAFNFLGKGSESIVLESGADFKKIHKEIIPPLKEIVLSKGKEFSGYGN